MNSAYAPNSQPKIPKRICQGHVVTTDLPTLGTNPSSMQHGNATQEVKGLGNLHCLGQTVRSALADSPQGASRRSARSRRMVRRWNLNNQYCTSKYGWSVPYPRTVCEQLVPRRRSAIPMRTVRKHPATKHNSSNGSNHERARTSDKLDNTWPRRLSAPTRRTVHQVQTEQLEPENEKSIPPIDPWITQMA
jgi:hypothetical protein